MRIVIKLGTKILLDGEDNLSLEYLRNITKQIGALKKEGHDIVLVSSGAVGAGRALLQKSNSPINTQILSSIGQAELIHHYNKCMKEMGLYAAQMLLTREDFKTRHHYLNIKNSFENSFQHGHIIPIVNENDPVTILESNFTDNDELASLIAIQIKADKLIILTSTEGIYDRDPEEQGASLLSLITPDMHQDLNIEEGQNNVGRGGVKTKLKAALKASQFGIETHIASGVEENVLSQLIASDSSLGTRVTACVETKGRGVKRWLASDISIETGEVYTNVCLTELLLHGEKILSLLPVGIEKYTGDFKKGDLILIKSHDHKILGKGVAKYDAKTLKQYMGQKNKPVFIHYDQLFLNKETL